LPKIKMPMIAPVFLYRLFRHVMPAARRQLLSWTGQAQNIPNSTLREQALASIQQKRFHADGGCVYAAMNLQHMNGLTRLIVAFQTISDYLDNLCDRCDTYLQADFHQLHHAMRDAVVPNATLHDYYLHRPGADDGGYLNSLVQACQEEIQRLPSYNLVSDEVRWLVERYCELQEYKHIEPNQRRPLLENWWRNYQHQFPHIEWWEFAAATGSTLGMFALFQAAAGASITVDAATIYAGYFPWICGLHILLDYLIDLEEDMAGGDFNFVRCYQDEQCARDRIRHFAKQSLVKVRGLPHSQKIHRYVVKGLLGMYLSDAKVKHQHKVRPARRLVWEFGPLTWLFYGACVWYRVVR